MAENDAAAKGRSEIIKDRSQLPMPEKGNWIRRDPSERRFMAMRRAGGRFKGVRRED